MGSSAGGAIRLGLIANLCAEEFVDECRDSVVQRRLLQIKSFAFIEILQ